MSIIVNRHITFIDSLQFYKGSLDTLESNLNNDDFKHLTSEFSIDKLEMLKTKDVYPYKWVNSYEKFKYPTLPPKKNTSTHHWKTVNVIKAMDIFLMNNTNTYEMFEIYLILILLKIFIIIT